MAAEYELTVGSLAKPLARPAREEILNGVTHAFGWLLSMAGTAVLMDRAVRSGGDALIWGCGLYSATLIAVYATSTLSHVVREPGRKWVFRVLDQAFIYLLIAGTYTPFALAYLSGSWWMLSALIWGVALTGFCSKILYTHRVEAISTSAYVLLGWLPLVAIKPLMTLVPAGAVALLLVGGVFYTSGTFFLNRDQKVPYFHAVWHVLVILGSLCHYLSILCFVV
jgi:hemolysin III